MCSSYKIILCTCAFDNTDIRLTADKSTETQNHVIFLEVSIFNFFLSFIDVQLIPKVAIISAVHGVCFVFLLRKQNWYVVLGNLAILSLVHKTGDSIGSSQICWCRDYLVSFDSLFMDQILN